MRGYLGREGVSGAYACAEGIRMDVSVGVEGVRVGIEAYTCGSRTCA
jgi:hypothetical protein